MITLSSFMHKIRQTHITQRMVILYQIMIIPMITLLILLLLVSSKLHDIETNIMIENVISIRAGYNVQNSIVNLRGFNAYYIITRDEHWIDEFQANTREFNQWFDMAEKYATTDIEKDILKQMSGDYKNYLECHKEIVNLVKKGDTRNATHVLLNKLHTYYKRIFDGCEKLIQTNDSLIRGKEKVALKYLKYSKIFGYAIVTFFIIIGIMVLLIITRSIINPLRQIEKESRGFSIGGKHKGELVVLQERFRAMMKSVNENQVRIIRSEKRAAIGEIAAGISHELNNPIGIISGFSELLLKSGKLGKKEMAIAQEIHRESIRCRGLLGDLLNFARTPKPNKRNTDIATLIRKIVSIYSDQERFRNVIFDVESSSPKIFLKIDPLQMRQVMENLINNACDAMKNKGKIGIDINTKQNITEIRIKDSGPGVAEDIIDKIFTPFFSTKKKGTVLGLAICRDIIDKHNGEIHCSSSGKGSIFSITLKKGVA
jgi:signal transduction histidine kinase